MKKTFLFSFLLTLLGTTFCRAENIVTGDGNTGTISVAAINDQGLTTINAGEGWTLTLEVENPNGASYNKWGTSILAIGANAFPEKNGYSGLQLYLQSSTNGGGKLDAVFGGGDHLIDNVTYTGNFSATITYDGDKNLSIETANASGTKATNSFTLANALPEITQFAYGLPTGINIAKLHIDQWSNDFTYTTTGTATNGKMHFTSDKIWYKAPCNKLRFTLTESGAFYSNQAKRMSFDSFVLYKADGTPVNLTADNISGNNTGKNFANMLDGANNTYCAGTWKNASAEDDFFEINLPNEVDLGGAFSFSFVTENTTMNAKAFRIEILNEEVEETKYTFAINAPEGKNVTVTYNGEPISSGDTFNAEAFNTDLFSANEINGYTWSIVVDTEAKTITLTYTEAAIVENPQAVVDLANRIGGAGSAEKFKFVLDPSMNSANEVFVLNTEDGKILVKGSTISAITTGLGWYLNHHANINIAWNSLNEKAKGVAYADLSNLPLPTTEEIHTCDAKYRYFLNYCTFGYSMTTWTWKRWQQEIDWMALHGINMPLQIVGLEEVWRMFLTIEKDGKRKYNYSDEEAKAFVAGPAYTAWWGMNNLEGWGGTSSDGWGGVQDDAWYARQATLAKSIVDRQRELGMQPVLPGFSGMVPTNFTTKTGIATDANGGYWCRFTRPRIIDPTYSGFADMAKDYYDCLEAVMGESQYYSMDPFHEGGSISSGKYTEAYKAIYDAMEAAKSGSQWVIQQWQWNGGNQRLSLNAVPAGRLIVLDLFSDGKPEFDNRFNYNAYAPQDAVFCAIPNFGGRSGLMGRLNNLTDNYFFYKGKFANIKGIGAAPEAIEQTPVTYDLLFQLPWMGSKPDVQAWVKKYAISRYGAENAVVQEAWELLRQSVLNYGADAIQGPVEDVWAARPNLNASAASTWGVTLNNAGGIYTPARRQMLIDATYKLLGQNDALNLAEGSIHKSNYYYDLVEFGGGVMADYAYDLLLGIKAAKEAAGNGFATDETYIARRDAFLSLIEDLDTFKGTNLNFRLGKWTQEARDAAAEVTGATTATADWYEFNNARTLITVWGDNDQCNNGKLKDYSYRSWQGLLKDYYLPRWKYFFDNNCTAPSSYFPFEWNWAHGMEHSVGQNAKSTTRLTEDAAGYSYSPSPEGNTVEEAQKLLNKYIIPVTLSEGTYYAYRYLTNDLTGKITIIAKAGNVIDLKQYFGDITNATVSGDFIDGNATDLSNIAIKADASDGAHTGIITLSDGTVLTFAVVLNPAYYGVYTINYKDGSNNAPVFVGYNEDPDNSNNKGYKLIATGTYTTDAEADKMFTIVPNGTGFSLSAQGKFLKSPTLSGWNHIMFSDIAEEAGAYVFEETNDTGTFKIRNTGDGINYVNDYDKLVFGNDRSTKADLSTFTITEATSFPFSIDYTGIATLCLPFNVIMPEGMYAYDLTSTNIVPSDNEGKYCCLMTTLAQPGNTLAKGTPVIVKAEEGNYNLTITMSEAGAKAQMNGSLLHGNFVKQTLNQDTNSKSFVLKNGDEGMGFYSMNESYDMAANKCWMEWSTPTELSDINTLTLVFDNETGIDNIFSNGEAYGNNSHIIYNIGGQRLNTPQKGLNIIGNKKMLVK